MKTLRQLLSLAAVLVPLVSSASWTLDGRNVSTNTAEYQPLGDYYTASDLDQFTLEDFSGTLKVADRFELNTMLNTWRLSILESREAGAYVDTWIDAFSDQSGVNLAATAGTLFSTNGYSNIGFTNGAGFAVVAQGSGVSIRRPQDFSNIYSGDAPYSVLFWVRLDNNDGNDRHLINFGGDQGDNNRGHAVWQNSNLSWFDHNAGDENFFDVYPTDTNWHHVAASYEAGVGKAYVDGVEVGTWMHDMRTNFSPTHGWFVGAWCDGSSAPVQGGYDELAFFSRALSSSEVYQVASGELPIADNATGLVYLLHMDEGSGTNLTDSGTNALTGWSLMNGSAWEPGTKANPAGTSGWSNSVVQTTNIVTDFVPEQTRITAYVSTPDGLGGISPNDLLAASVTRQAATSTTWTAIGLSNVATVAESPVTYVLTGQGAFTDAGGTNVVLRFTLNTNLAVNLRGIGASWK